MRYPGYTFLPKFYYSDIQIKPTKIKVFLFYTFIFLYSISIILVMNILMVELASLFFGTARQLLLFYFLLSNIISRQLRPIFAPINGQGDSPGM